MLSIIIPALNEERYIGKLLDCLTKQTFKEFEVIVVDGGSTDKTLDRAYKFKTRLKIRIIKLKKSNLAKARNAGGFNAQGEILLFLDADTTFEEDYLKNSLSEIRKRNLRFAGSGFYPNIDDWKYTIFFGCLNFFGGILERIHPMCHGCCTFMEKSLFLRVGGYNEKLSWLDDKEIGKRLKKITRFGLLKSRVTLSVRRFEQEGTRLTMKRWGKAYYYYVIGNPEKTNKIDYKFGHYTK